MTFAPVQLLKSSVGRGIGANVYGQLIQVAAQFATVAVMAPHWGLQTYGTWLLLFTVPAYLAFTDFGLSAAATAEMTGLIAQDRRDEAVAVYQAARAATLLANMAILVVAAVLVFGMLGPRLMSLSAGTGGSAALMIMMLVCYGCATLQNGVTGGALSATGGYATGVYVTATMTAVETATACAIVAAGGRIVDVAGAYLAVRVIGSIALGVALHRRAPWLTALRWRSSLASLTALFRPAAAIIAMAGAQAASFQGTVSVVGLVGGAAAVPMFTTVRTVSRIAAQGVLVVNHAIMPSYSMAHGRGDRAAMARYVLVGIAVSLICAGAAAVGMMLGARAFVGWWTGGVVRPGLPLLAVLAVSMVAFTLWQPLVNLLMATNRHGRVAWYYLGAAMLALAACLPLTRVLGPTGAGVSIMLLDLAMLARVVVVTRQLDMVRWRALPRSLAGLRTRPAS